MVICERSPLIGQPVFKLRQIADVEAWEQFPLVELHRLGVLAFPDEASECDDVTPDQFVRDADLVIAAVHDRILAERRTQMEQRLAQRAARTLLVRFRPEEREESIPTMEDSPVQRQINEQR